MLDREKHRQPSKTVWVTRDGERIPVKKMTDNHLCNTIKLLLHAAPGHKLREERELSRAMDVVHGDAATLAVENEYYMLSEMSIEDYLDMRVPTWEALLNEAVKRGLVRYTDVGDLEWLEAAR